MPASSRAAESAWWVNSEDIHNPSRALLEPWVRGLRVDYAFAPGGTPYDRLSRVLLRRMPNTTLIDASALAQPAAGPASFDVAAFINHLQATAAIAKPVGNLLIATHGNASGFMTIDLDRVSLDETNNDATTTTYEVLVQAIASGSATIHTVLHANPPNPAVAFDIHIRGCRIGQQPRFVQKLKQAFVRARSVTAPKHFHIVGGVGSRRKRLTRYGSFECLFYSFSLSRIARPPGVPSDPAIHNFRDPPEAVAQFNGAGFTFIDGTAVPRGRWQSWIPRKNLRPRSPGRPVRLGQNVGRNFRRFRLDHTFRVRTQPFTVTVPGIAANPGTDPQREAILRNYITAHPAFQANHAFPFYERHGFATANAFLDGHRWGCVWDQDASTLICVGRRRVYTVIVPVLDPATNQNPIRQHLFFNLFPAAGSGLVRVTRLNVGDPRLFLTV